MADTLQITLAPQLELNVAHSMGGVAAGFTIIAGISRSTGGGAGNEYLNAEKVKLAGIETAATADQTGAEIKVLYELEANTNAFTDLEQAKLGDIEDDATADQSNSEIKTAYEANANTNVHTDAQVSKLAGIETAATADQSNSEIKIAYELNGDTNAFNDAAVSKLTGIQAGATDDQSAAEIRAAVEAASNSNVFTDNDHSKLNAIEANATADQTDAQIKAAVEAATDSNTFTDADHSKLNAIEAGATTDQTDSEIETAYNAQVDQIDAAEIAAGTEGAVRRVAPDDVVAMIVTHAPAAIASAHYQDPVENIAELTALPEAGLVDAERRFVELQVADYFYDIDASSGDEQPDDQTGGTGFWITVADTGGGSSPAQIKSKYEKNANTNAFEDAEKTSLATMEDGATADQTDAEIRTAVGAATDSNVYDDAAVSSLASTVTVANNALPKAGGIMDGELIMQYGTPSIRLNEDDQSAGNDNAKFYMSNGVAYLQGTSNGKLRFSGYSLADLTVFEARIGGVWEDMLHTGSGAIMDGDFTAGEGILRKTGSGAYVAMKSNLGAATNPVVTSDTAAGYVVGSRWINTTLDKEYVCLDATNGAAVWTETTSVGGGGMSDAEVKTAYENNANTNEFSDAEQASLATMEDNATADQSNSEIAAAYAAEVGQVSGGEITAGTESTLRTYAPDDIVAFIAAHESGGSATGVNNFTDDHTLALTDATDIVEMEKATANVLLIPTNAAVAFPIGVVISIMMMDDGVTSITGDTGVTLNGVSAGSGEMTGKFGGVSLYQRATDVWVVNGSIGDVA